MFLVGTGAESVIIQAFNGNRPALEWISDVLISSAVAGLAYLWLHLRESRTLLLETEKAGIVIDEQLRLAASIQRNLLPDIPATTSGLQWAARMVPAGQIGGDFYDFLEKDDGTTLVFLGDISGKGVPAALLHASLRTAFRLVTRETSDPVEIAERISQLLHAQTEGLPYATAIVARFKPGAGEIEYVNAGHPVGMLFCGGPERRLEAGGPPLGVIPGPHYQSGRLELRPGDIGVMVTDGITEALEGSSVNVSDLLRGRLQSLCELGSPKRVCDVLLAAAAEAPGPIGAGDWHDDATALVFRVA